MSDERHLDARKPVACYHFTQQTWASGASGAKTATLNLNGICEQIEVKVNNNTGDRTATVALATANGGTLFNVSGIAENATTVLKATSDATDFDAFLCDGAITATITPSGDPGESGMTVDVYVYLV